MSKYTFDLIRSALLELFCAPRSSLDNPSFRPSNQPRPFCVHDYGELEGAIGYWATEAETGQGGFVQEFEDIVWVYDVLSDAWAARHFKGGRRLNKGFRRVNRKVSKRWNKGTRFCPSYEVQHKGKGKSKGKTTSSK